MPYFKWVGVDIRGVTCKGKLAAHSLQELSERLLSRGIALLRSKSVYTPSFVWPINGRVKGDLFGHKAQLLRAGILLPKIVTIVEQQIHNPILSDILFTVGEDMQQGVSFAAALKKQPRLSDPIVNVMLAAGYESGDLVNAIENVSRYYHKQYLFNKAICSVLAIPFLTLLFFIGISCFIFIFIIPRFAEMFQSFHQELPALTQCMINISNFVSSFSMLFVFAGIIFFVVGIYYYCTTVGKKVWDNFLIQLPFIGTMVWQHQMCQTLQALSLLVMSGTTLISALKIVSEAVENSVIKRQITELYDDVASGLLLSQAMSVESYFLPEVVALICVGEESGMLGKSFEDAAIIYRDRVEQSMRRFVFFLQPTVIILLGFLVTMLIFAVYLPILQLSHAI